MAQIDGKKVYKEEIDVIKSIYEENKNYVRSQNMESKWFTTMNGLRQVGELNPLLFTIMLDDNIKTCDI